MSSGAQITTDALNVTEPLEPVDELGVAGASSRERLDAQHTVVGVDRSSDMELEVGVDPDELTRMAHGTGNEIRSHRVL